MNIFCNVKLKCINESVWLLKLSNEEDALKYMKSIECRLLDVTTDFLKSGERQSIMRSDSEKREGGPVGSHLTYKESMILFGTLLKDFETGKRTNVRGIECMSILYDLKLKTIIDGINKYGSVFINKVGGVVPANAIEKEFSTKQKRGYRFPKYDESDIKITQWRNGNHYYASIGIERVVGKDGREKWDSYDDAKKNAISYLKKINK